MKAPFPWFGGKSRAAGAIWQRLGDVQNYVEPFAGSLAVLLQRPHEARTETVNDLDCYLANFWRAVAHEPEAVAVHADWPCNEADLHARHTWLIGREWFRERMKAEPDFYDVKIAGWWVWGQSLWIGSGWCDADCYFDGDQKLPHLGNAGRGVHRPSQQLPHLGDAGRGVHRPSQKLPHLGDAGMGVHRPSQQLPHLGNAGMGVHRPSQQLPHLGSAGMGDIYDYFAHLGARLRRVRVACGDWSRVLGDSVTFRHGVTGVLLDPPYGHDERQADLYANDLDVAPAVRDWAIECGDNPLMRIALCGYEDEHEMPASWSAHRWKARGGYGSQGNGSGRANAAREMIWFSPHCLQERELTLFGTVAD